MDIGLLRERRNHETRLLLTPSGVERLTNQGHRVFFESGAGEPSFFSDRDYQAVGATLVYSADEVWGRAEMLAKVLGPTAEECGQLGRGQILLGFLSLAVEPLATLQALVAREVTSIALELIQDEHGRRPVQRAMSEIAGALCGPTAAYYLQSQHGGRGLLLGGIPGIAPAVVVILGAGVLGQAAARSFLGLGAQVILLDQRIEALQAIDGELARHCVTALSEPANLARFVSFADVVLGAVFQRGGPAPLLLSRQLVKSMKPGSLLLDAAIDQGGCAETSRPTTLAEPTYRAEGVLHYSVPNIPASVGRTSSYALNNAVVERLMALAQEPRAALTSDPGLASAVATYAGHCLHADLAERLNRTPAQLASLLESPNGRA
ncbi:MAG TPA: alanine dehydrogenase [Acidobacteriota bacterium]